MGSTQSTWGSHFDHDPATDPTNETMNALVLVALALGASGQQFQREFDNFVQNPRFNFVQNQRNNFANDDVVVLNNDALSTSFGNAQQQQQQQRQSVNQFTSDNFQVLAPAPLTNDFSTQFSNSQQQQQQQQNSFGASRTNAQQQQSSFGASNTQGSSSFFRTGESSSAFSGQQVGEFEESFGAFEPLNLPSGASVLLGSISSQFSCLGLPYGYYADEDNSCRVFHVCNPLSNANEGVETYQYSFMCGEGTQFDQRQL